MEIKSVVTKPELTGGLGQGGDMDLFVKIFGSSWKNTSHKSVWCLAVDGVQFTVVYLADYLDIARYDFETVKDFHEAFDAKKHTDNDPYYFQWQSGGKVKYPALSIIEILKGSYSDTHESMWDELVARVNSKGTK